VLVAASDSAAAGAVFCVMVCSWREGRRTLS